MIHLPTNLDEALIALASGEPHTHADLRAGGTDLQERRTHLAIHDPDHAVRPVVDLRDVAGLDAITIDAATRHAWVGARTTLQALADHPLVRERWPGVAEASGALANPQIRRVATVAGNLLQKPRCWYYRHPDYVCLQRGGDTCYARDGDHRWHVAFDRAACAAPHPSTVGMALLAYDAEVEVVDVSLGRPQRVGVDQLLARGVGPTAIVTAIRLPPPIPGERAAYVRASNRARAEWALVEATVRLIIDDGTITDATVAVGAVAPTPLRLTAVEDLLRGQTPTDEVFARASARAIDGAAPLPQTGYKLALLEGTVLTALEQARDATPTPAAIPPVAAEGAQP